MSDFDLIVAGGGFSGLMAAVFAARRGAKVLLITRGSGVLAVGGGTIDVLGYLPDGTPLASPFAGLHRLPPRHPYRLVGSAAVRRALDEFAALTRDEGFPYRHNGEANTGVVTALGTVKPSYLVPESMDMRDLGAARRVRIVGVEGLKDFTPAFIASGLSRRRAFAGAEFSLVLLPNPFALQRDLSTLDLARYLDTEDGARWLTEELRARAGRSERPEAAGGEAILLPPLLGTRAAARVHAAVRESVGCEIHEVVSLPPAVTGLRLHHLLLRLLKKLDVELIEQSNVTGSGVENGRCAFLSTTNGGKERRYRATSYIVATGGVLGEGLLTGPHRSWEPIFNLELGATAADPGWALPCAYPSCPDPEAVPGAASCAGPAPDQDPARGPAPVPHHGFALLGPAVDGLLRPLAPDGRVVCDNVHFVGKTLGGYDHASEKSGNGVALATAYHAVQCALASPSAAATPQRSDAGGVGNRTEPGSDHNHAFGEAGGTFEIPF